VSFPRRQIQLFDQVLIPVCSQALSMFLLVPMHRCGFYSFLPALACLLLIATLLLKERPATARSADPAAKQTAIKGAYVQAFMPLTLGFLLCIPVATTWLVLAPMCLLLVLTAAVRAVWFLGFRRVTNTLLKALVPSFVALALAQWPSLWSPPSTSCRRTPLRSTKP